MFTPRFEFRKLNGMREQPASKSPGCRLHWLCSVTCFPVQSRRNCIRIPPGVGEMQITYAAAPTAEFELVRCAPGSTERLTLAALPTRRARAPLAVSRSPSQSPTANGHESERELDRKTYHHWPAWHDRRQGFRRDRRYTRARHSHTIRRRAYGRQARRCRRESERFLSYSEKVQRKAEALRCKQRQIQIVFPWVFPPKQY